MKIYTKTGDKGTTSLFDGTRVNKDALRVESYGTIDELGSALGLARCFVEDKEISQIILRMQRELFDVASELATSKENKEIEKINEGHISCLEGVINHYIELIPKVDKFIIPGTSKSSASLHVARTICRRAERRIVALAREDKVREEIIKYVNRLSDAIYTMARFLEEELIYVNFKE